MVDQYLESARGDPGEIAVKQGTNRDRLWLEQSDDMIELDDQQASALIKALTDFLARG